MSGAIGSSTPQIQPSIIQNGVGQNAQKQVVSQDKGQPKSQVAQAASNKDFVKLAQEIINQRASGSESSSSAAQQRGQVLDLIV